MATRNLTVYEFGRDNDRFHNFALGDESASFWDSQAETEPAPWTRSGYSNLYFVADDFSLFVNSLDTFDEYARRDQGGPSTI